MTSTEGSAAPPWRRLTPYAVGVVVAFACYPFVAFLNRNRVEITDVMQLVGYLALVLVLALGALLVIAALRPKASIDHIGVGIAVFLACFFGFHLIFNVNPAESFRLPQIGLWAVLTVLLVAVCSRFARLAPLRTFILVLGVLLTLLPLVDYVGWRVTADDHRAGSRIEAADGEVPDVVDRPNVYLFVLDEYARNDAMANVLGYDNSAFYEDLRDRDFVVEEDVHAPFQQTIMSMASVLEMDYIATTPEEATGGSMAVTDRLRGDNATVDYFRALGYQYVYSTPGLYSWNRCVPDLVDLCIEPMGKGIYLDEMERALLELTPIGSLRLLREAVTDPAYVIQQLEEHRDEVDEPFFLYSHVISPHWPYRYTEDCTLRSRFGYTPYLLDKSEEDQERYLQDVKCLNELVVQGVDEIIEDDPDAVIIVMSDHGSKFIPDGAKRLEEWRPEALREELGVLHAMRVPERCRADVEDNANSVNTFRIVAACLEDRPTDYLDDRSFLWPHTGPGPQEIEDVSVLDPQP